MILVDTGPFVALFDPKDASHRRCREVLKTLRQPLVTTVPVLTEAFHSDRGAGPVVTAPVSKILGWVTVSRRHFVPRLIGGTFALPLVTSFSLDRFSLEATCAFGALARARPRGAGSGWAAWRFPCT